MLVICLVGVFPAQAQESGDLLGRINNLRAQHGLPGYSSNGALSVAAQQQAQWIVDTGTVAHTHPDGSGPRTRALAAGYPSIQVGENIYGGTNATVNDAWTFWLNSPIHFQGMVSNNYQEIGIGVAHGSWGSSFVLVFGGSGAPPPAAGAPNTGNQAAASIAAAGPPAYVGGIDENGNIKHIVQPGDTLGDIALIYGYTWDDLPRLMQLNGLTDVRDLEVGSIFLVPSSSGTYTPTPDDRPPTETPVPTAVPPTITPFVVSTTAPEATQETAISPIATAGGDVQPPTPPAEDNVLAADGTEVAALPTQEGIQAITASAAPRTTASTWIMIAVGVQALVVVGAGIEFMRRTLRKNRRRR